MLIELNLYLKSDLNEVHFGSFHIVNNDNRPLPGWDPVYMRQFLHIGIRY
jgi:hypothetical protein